MTDPLRFVPPRVAFVDPRTGMITREWYLFLQGIFNRVGGASGEGTADISSSMFEDAGGSETNAMLFALAQAVDQTPAPQTVVVDSTYAELTELREVVAELKKTIESIQQGSFI